MTLPDQSDPRSLGQLERTMLIGAAAYFMLEAYFAGLDAGTRRALRAELAALEEDIRLA